VVSKISSFASDSGIVGCTAVADGVDVIGDVSSLKASKHFDLRSNEVRLFPLAPFCIFLALLDG